jgi:hypothetical protein
MRTEIFRRLAGVVCAAALVWLAVPVVPAQADEVELTEAVLRWGLNNEANNRSPQGRMNFLSAGQIPKPADGELRETGWSQSAGLVSIEKWNGKTYQPATWAGLSTDAGGKPISGFMSGSYTGHQTVFRGGQGTVDRDAGTAHIEWQGSASIVFYGGMVFFHLADPVLDVTASGSHSDRHREWLRLHHRFARCLLPSCSTAGHSGRFWSDHSGRVGIHCHPEVRRSASSCRWLPAHQLIPAVLRDSNGTLRHLTVLV